jgi:hypothetical protein
MDNNSLENNPTMMKKNTIDEGLNYRVEIFLGEIHARYPYKKLYDNGHTNAIVRKQKINFSYFQRLFSRMREGKGLFCNPALLGAVLYDMNYPADMLFCNNRKPLTAEFVLGPGTAKEIQGIIAKAVNVVEKPLHQLGIKKRISAAFSVLMMARFFQNNENYENAMIFLFFQYSISNLSLYPHGRIKSIESIDNLAKFHFTTLDNSQLKLVGSVLVLAYLLFEISRISFSLIKYSNICKNKAVEIWPTIIGFKYDNEKYQNEINCKVIEINNIFSEITGKITSKETLPSFDIPKNTIQTSINLLEKLLDFKISNYNNNVMDMKELAFNNLINKNRNVIYHFYTVADNNLLILYDNVINILKLFNNNIVSNNI